MTLLSLARGAEPDGGFVLVGSRGAANAYNPILVTVFREQ